MSGDIPRTISRDGPMAYAMPCNCLFPHPQPTSTPTGSAKVTSGGMASNGAGQPSTSVDLTVRMVVLSFAALVTLTAREHKAAGDRIAGTLGGAKWLGKSPGPHMNAANQEMERLPEL